MGSTLNRFGSYYLKGSDITEPCLHERFGHIINADSAWRPLSVLIHYRLKMLLRMPVVLQEVLSNFPEPSPSLVL